MKYINLVILTIALLSTFSACKKEEASAPTITVTNPTEGGMYHSGSTLSIEFTIEDKDELHDYSFKVTNTTANQVVSEVSDHSHEKNLTVTQDLALNVTAHSDFVLEVTANNHNGLSTTQTVNFHVHPM